MSFTFNPESKLQERVGHVTVATLLAVVFLGLVGCDIPIGGDKEKKAAREQPTVQASSWVAPTADVPAPAEKVEVPKFDPATVTFEEAGAAYDERRYADAVDMFEAYTDRRPDNAWGHYMLGLSALKAGQLDQAEVAFNRSLALDPNHLKSMLNLGRVLLKTDRPERALSHVEVVIDIDPVSDDGYRLRGLAFYELGREEDAIDSFREAITVNQHDAWSMNNLGLVLIRKGQFEEALYPLARATELRGDVVVFQNNLGIALERTGHFEASADAYRAALALNDAYEKASVSLARIEALQEDPTTGPVDLKVLALRFVAEMEGWYPPMAHVPPVEEGVVDTEQPEVTEIELPEFPVIEEIAELPLDSTEAEVKVEVEHDTVTVKADSTKVESDTSGVAKIKPIKP